MRFSVPAVSALIFCLGSATLTVASVSSAAPLAGNVPATLLSSPSANGASTDAVPHLEPAVLTTTDTTPSFGTQLPQSQPIPVTPEAPAASLAALVDQNDDNPGNLDAEMTCLASAVFYEARSESLAGKLAVARVIINRTESGRFPRSVCGVVTQPGQFSFVHGGHIPAISSSGSQWTSSVSIARIAMADEWKSPAEGALYFHAARVAPGWGRPVVARVDNHVFYR